MGTFGGFEHTRDGARTYGRTWPRTAAEPTLFLDFASATSLDPRITFSRGSQATLFDSTGTLVYAKHNLLTYSQPLNTGWVKAGTATVTDNNATAPDGTVAAALVSSPATGDYIYQTPTTVIGQSYIFSVFVKNSTATINRLWVRTSSTAAEILLNWSGATLSSVTQTSGTATFTSVGNDWYRVFVTYTAVETAARHRIYGGDGTSTTGNILVWGAQLNITNMEGGVTSSLTTYYPTTTAAYYAPRFDYNPSTLQPRGLLIEEQRTNSVLQSEDFATTWSLSAATVTTNATTAPSGTNTADKLVETATTAAHYAQQTVTVTSGIAYTFSVFAKAGERTALVLLTAQSTSPFTNHAVIEFDLTNGTIIGTSAGSGTITSVGNGWYRCTATGTTTSTGEIVRCSFATVGDGTSGLFLWGAQLEVGAFATSYIPTTTTALTRNADVASMTGTNFSSWYNQTEGSFVMRGLTSNATATKQWIAVDDGSSANRIRLATNASRQAFVDANVASVSQGVTLTSNVFTLDFPFTQAIRYALNDAAVCLNGGTVATDTSFNVPTVNRLGIGSGETSPVQICNGWIARIAYYPTRLPDATLQALTA